MTASHRSAVLRVSTPDRDGLVQRRRRLFAEHLVEIRQLLAVQAIEIAHAVRRIVITEPPEPVRSLADRQLAFQVDRSFAVMRREPMTRS